MQRRVVFCQTASPVVHARNLSFARAAKVSHVAKIGGQRCGSKLCATFAQDFARFKENRISRCNLVKEILEAKGKSKRPRPVIQKEKDPRGSVLGGSKNQKKKKKVKRADRSGTKGSNKKK